MADAAGSYPKLQRLASGVASSHDADNARKFYYNFLYKVLIVAIIFLVILPLSSSQTPEFINQNLHNASCELVQLIFVGIAVSYGLFSRKRSEETDKEHSSKFDNAQSYVSRLLPQVPSVFDDEAGNTSDVDDNKIQTWNSQYYRGEPVVVVAKDRDSPNHQDSATTCSKIRGDKPLLLPVRSLKSPVSQPDMLETTQESTRNSGSLSRSSLSSGSKSFSSSNKNKFGIGEPQGLSPLNLEENLGHRSGSKRFPVNTSKCRNEVLGDTSPLSLQEEAEESVVHRSPIPWRSRSGRMGMKEDVDGRPLYPTSPSGENSESIRLQSCSFRSLSFKSSRVDSNSPSPNKLSPSSSPKKLSPSPSWSMESRAKSVEDVERKKSFHRSSTPQAPPPPPPPPLPPPFLRKSTLMKSNSSLPNDEVTPIKELRRSIRIVPLELWKNERVEPPHSGPELRAEAQSDGSYVAKSVGAIRPNGAVKNEMKTREFSEVDDIFVDESEYGDKFIHENFPTMTKRTVLEFPEEGKQEYMEKVVIETDEDTETESEDDDYFEEVPGGKEEVMSPSKEEAASEGVSDGGPDVDKKADEFIAKFREQIRLQRIESIRRSTRQQHHPRNLSR